MATMRGEPISIAMPSVVPGFREAAIAVPSRTLPSAPSRTTSVVSIAVPGHARFVAIFAIVRPAPPSEATAVAVPRAVVVRAVVVRAVVVRAVVVRAVVTAPATVPVPSLIFADGDAPQEPAQHDRPRDTLHG